MDVGRHDAKDGNVAGIHGAIVNSNEPIYPMKNKTHPGLLVRGCFALSVALILWSPLRAQPAEPKETTMKADSKMMADCQEMMAKKEKMMADMKAQDAELTEHVAKMNQATGPEQTKIMAAVITHMVELRISTDAQKAKMEKAMMAHMMEHMQMGAKSMGSCPMMKGMGDMDDKSSDAHKMHHEESK